MRIAHQARDRIGEVTGVVPTRPRHTALLQQATRHFADFGNGPTDQLELRAEDIRLAAIAIGRLTGRIDVEDMLDQIFSRFCIGK
jgi:tRNA modification GTPase